MRTDARGARWTGECSYRRRRIGFEKPNQQFNTARTEQDNIQERNPAQVFKERSEEIPLTKSILEQRISDIAKTGENDRAREQNLETVQIETVKLWGETQDQVIDDGADGGRGDAICNISVQWMAGHIQGGNSQYENMS